MAVSLQECSCYHLSRSMHHGKLIRTAYEDAVVQIVRNSLVHRDSEVRSTFNIAVIGSGGLHQDYEWLQKLFQGRTPGHLHLDLVDLDYKEHDSRVAALKQCFTDRIQRRELSISAWSSCEALRATKQMHHLVIGMDTELATPDAQKYQWESLLKGDIEKALLVRWNVWQNRHCFEISSRSGSEPLNTQGYFYDRGRDSKGKMCEFVSQGLASTIAEHISAVPYTG